MSAKPGRRDRIAEYARLFRGRPGWTQADIAKWMVLDVTTISRYERVLRERESPDAP